jgi:hypothetical protein
MKHNKIYSYHIAGYTTPILYARGIGIKMLKAWLLLKLYQNLQKAKGPVSYLRLWGLEDIVGAGGGVVEEECAMPHLASELHAFFN